MAEAIQVTVAHSPQAGLVRECALRLPPGARVQDAIDAAGLARPADADDIGIWGRRAPLQQVLRGGERVEIYRPLRADPKTARRERFARQGARAAGLFRK